MRDISQYFDLITRVAERSGAASVDIEFNQRDPMFGRVNGVISFYDSSRLEFRETVAYVNSSNNALASFKSAVSNPSVNQT
jgi:hypothetical protein